jgi:hypothetical protein
VPVEDTIIDVNRGAGPRRGEFETIRTATRISSDREAKPGTGAETEEQ